MTNLQLAILITVLVGFLYWEIGRAFNKVWKKLWELQDKIDFIEGDIRGKNIQNREK